MKRGLSFSVEIILLLILFMLYFYQVFPKVSISEYYRGVVDDLYINSLAYSLIDQRMKQVLDHFDIDLIYITFKQVLSSRFNRFYIKLHYYEPVLVKGSGDCIIFMYPIPYGSPNINLKVYRWDGIQCTNLSYSNDWYMFIITGLNKSLASQNISINISGYSNLLDPYSLFLFDIDGNPLKINAIAIDNNFLNLSIENIYNGEVIIVGRIKNSTMEQDLTYLAGRYSIVSKIKDATYISYKQARSSWITLAIDKNCYSSGKLLIEITYPEEWKINKNYDITICRSAQSVYYSNINFFRSFVDIIKLQGILKTSYKYGSSVTLPGLTYSTIDIYVA